MKPTRVGIAFGLFLGAFHLFWALLVAFGLAQPLLDFVFMLHMINPPYVVGPFNVLSTIGLIIFTSLVGYIAGYLFVTLLNWAHKTAHSK